MSSPDADRLGRLAGTLTGTSGMVPSSQVTGGGGGSLPAGLICMWSGLLANIPSGWLLCDGANGTPDLRGKFVKGSLAGINPGVTGGAATHTHAGHAAHVLTQPSDHAALTHSGAAVADHTVTQPSAHSNHAFTQSSAHPNHVVTQPANHVFTQASAHSAHVVTQPSAHSAHAALGTHAHELPFTKVAGGTAVFRMLAGSIFGTGTSRAPESQSAAPTANTTAAPVALSQAITAGTPDAHSAHAGSAVDAHSAHAGSGVDAHSATAVDAHSGHSGGAVDAHSAHSGTGVSTHSVTQPGGHGVQSHTGAAVDAHSAHDTVSSEPAFYSLAYIMKS